MGPSNGGEGGSGWRENGEEARCLQERGRVGRSGAKSLGSPECRGAGTIDGSLEIAGSGAQGDCAGSFG